MGVYFINANQEKMGNEPLRHNSEEPMAFIEVKAHDSYLICVAKTLYNIIIYVYIYRDLHIHT